MLKLCAWLEHLKHRGNLHHFWGFEVLGRFGIAVFSPELNDTCNAINSFFRSPEIKNY